MNNFEIESIVRAVRRFRFPPGVDRTISTDVERAAVHVVITSSGHFQMLSFRRPMSPDRVQHALEQAALGLGVRPPNSPLPIDVGAMGRG